MSKEEEKESLFIRGLKKELSETPINKLRKEFREIQKNSKGGVKATDLIESWNLNKQ